MYAVKAIYDRDTFFFDEPIPVKGPYEAVITFERPAKLDQSKLLDFVGMWDEDDVKLMQEMIDERDNFSLGRPEV